MFIGYDNCLVVVLSVVDYLFVNTTLLNDLLWLMWSWKNYECVHFYSNIK